MLEGILVGIAGNGLYKAIDTTISKLTSSKDDDLFERIHESLDQTSKVFFEKFNYTSTEQNDSFLAREGNIELIINSFFYDHNIDLYAELHREGFGNVKELSDEELTFFINTFRYFIDNDIKLSFLVSSKEHFNESKQMKDDIAEIKKMLETQKTEEENPSTNKKPKFDLRNERGEKIEYKEGEKKNFKFPNGVEYTILMKDGKLFVEYTSEKGKPMYIEVNENFEFQNMQLAHKLEEYTLSIDDSEIIKKETENLSDGTYQEDITMKWGRSIKVRYGKNRKILGIEAKGGWGTNDDKRLIYPRDL